MATLNGRKLSQKELTILEKKWQSEDRKFWRDQITKDIVRKTAHISKLKKLPKTTLSQRLIAKHSSELAQLRAKKSKL